MRYKSEELLTQVNIDIGSNLAIWVELSISQLLHEIGIVLWHFFLGSLLCLTIGVDFLKSKYIVNIAMRNKRKYEFNSTLITAPIMRYFNINLNSMIINSSHCLYSQLTFRATLYFTHRKYSWVIQWRSNVPESLYECKIKQRILYIQCLS